MKSKSAGIYFLIVSLAVCGALSAFGATLTVTNTNDSGEGSLRDTLASAASGDTINFSLVYPATIALSSSLIIERSVTISGPGASNLAISGNNNVIVFVVHQGAGGVRISSLTVENGGTGGASVGGIFNGDTLTITDSVISNNTARTGGGGIYPATGGGIFNLGVLQMSNSTVSGNSASGGVGGGIYNNGMLTLTNSTISGNSADSGGGIYNQGTLILTNAVVSGNSATLSGGGIYNDGTLTLADTTVSDNSANFMGDMVPVPAGAGSGGGVFNFKSGTFTMTNTTVSSNSATYFGGGIYSIGTVTLKNGVIANSGSGGNCSASGIATSDGHNLSDDTTCSTFLTATGDLNNTPAGLDPNGLQDNGGPTLTIALLPTSPAVDAIPVSPSNYCTEIDGITAVATDQRGISRPQGSACDIGAFELQPQSGFTPTGSNVSDQPVDATASGTPVTLTFATVTQAGTTTLTTTSGGPPPPTAFKLGNPPVYYNLSTTAVFSGSVAVCVNYAGTTFGNPSKLRLFHYENNAWTDVTTSVDTASMTICGSVTSLSPFAIFESAYTASIQSPIKPDGSSVFAANRGVIPVKFTLDLNGTITCQLPPATISLTRTAGGTLGAVNESSFSMQSDSGSNFRIDTANCQYVYNLGASALGTGTYSVQIVIGNIVAGDGSFGLK